MPFNDRLIDTEEAAAVNGGGGTGNQEEGLRIHLDANDVDSYDGDGDVWYDIADHEYTPATDVSEHFNTVLYTGTSATNSITGVGFQPDLVWLKQRNSAQNHGLFDSVRGANNFLSSNLTAAAETRTTDTLSSFDSDGFTLTGYTSDVFINYTGRTMVAWCFKAGGAPTASTPYMIDGTGYATLSEAGLADDGDLDLHEASINTKLGFAIYRFDPNNVSGETASFEHGLGTTPELVITKSASNVYNWWTWTNQIDGSWDYLKLNGQDAKANDTFTSGNFADATTMRFPYVFTGVSSNHVAYAFTSKRGVSKVGSYKGTGSGGNKVVTGFEPAWLMVKNTDSSGSWTIFDNKRDTENPNEQELFPNLNYVENTTTTNTIDFNRDGFTLKGSATQTNGSNNNYIFLAFAKSTNETSLIPDTDLTLHLDPTSYSGSGSTWTADVGSDATISGAAYDQELGDWFDFDGSNDYISVPSTSSTPVDFTAKNYTIELWINPDTSGVNQIFTKYGSSDSFRSISIIINTDNTLRLIQRSSTTDNSYSTSTIPQNTWTHIVVARSSSEVKFYINGELDNAVSNTFTPNSGGNQPILIGTNSTTTPTYFNGKIGQVRTYSSELTQAQIRQNFNFTKNDYPNGYNATRIGATFSPSTTPNYWSFDGINDAMLLSTTSTLLGDTNNIKTISAFVTLSSTSARGHIYSVSASNNSNDFFYIGWFSDTNKVHITSRDGSSSNSFTHSAPLTAVANTWKHICITGGDGNTPKIYANGVELTVTSSTSGTATNASWINYPSYSGTVYTYVGKLRQYLPASTHWHNGRIGQVKLYDETLTSTEVLALFNAEKDTYGL